MIYGTRSAKYVVFAINGVDKLNDENDWREGKRNKW